MDHDQLRPLLGEGGNNNSVEHEHYPATSGLRRRTSQPTGGFGMSTSFGDSAEVINILEHQQERDSSRRRKRRNERDTDADNEAEYEDREDDEDDDEEREEGDEQEQDDGEDDEDEGEDEDSGDDEDEEDKFDIVEALAEQMSSYDEALYYAVKEYIDLHQLYHKQQQKGNLKKGKKKDTASIIDSAVGGGTSSSRRARSGDDTGAEKTGDGERQEESFGFEATASTSVGGIAALPWRYRILTIWTRPLATRYGLVYFIAQFVLVIATILQLLFESSPRYSPIVRPEFKVLWDAIELPICFLFTLDLIAYFCFLPYHPNDFTRSCRRTFFKKPEVWIDIMTVVPTYYAFVEGYMPYSLNLEFLKALRALRFTRVLRQFHSVDQIAHTMERSLQPLFGPFFFLTALVITLSSAIYFAEKGTYDPERMQYMIHDCECEGGTKRALDPEYPCPLVPSRFLSIPHTTWFTLVTMTTVGYGDIVPVCHWGKSLAVVAMFVGNVVTAMPIAIVGAYFTSIIMTNKARESGEEKAQTFRGKGNAARARRRKQRQKQQQKQLSAAKKGFGYRNKETEEGRTTRATRDASPSSSSSVWTHFHHHAHREQQQQSPQQQHQQQGKKPLQDSPPNQQHPHHRHQGSPSSPPSTSSSSYDQLLYGREPIGDKVYAILANHHKPIDLLDPPSALQHRVNNAIRHELDNVTQALLTRRGFEAAELACEHASKTVSLELVSAPIASQMPRVLQLDKPTTIVFGTCHSNVDAMTYAKNLDESAPVRAQTPFIDHYVAVGDEACRGLPQLLFSASLCSIRNSVSVTAIFPARVTVNGRLLNFKASTKLLVGDVLTVHRRSAHDGPDISFQFMKSEVRQGTTVSSSSPLFASPHSPSSAHSASSRWKQVQEQFHPNQQEQQDHRKQGEPDNAVSSSLLQWYHRHRRTGGDGEEAGHAATGGSADGEDDKEMEEISGEDGGVVRRQSSVPRFRRGAGHDGDVSSRVPTTSDVSEVGGTGGNAMMMVLEPLPPPPSYENLAFDAYTRAHRQSQYHLLDAHEEQQQQQQRRVNSSGNNSKIDFGDL